MRQSAWPLPWPAIECECSKDRSHATLSWMLQVEESGLPFTSQETNAVVVHLQKGLKVLVAVPRSNKDTVLSGIALSETSLTDDWLNPDEEEAWAHLRAPKTYTGKVGLALFSPMTSKINEYPFEVKLPDGYGVTGVVLSDPSRGATKAAMDRCSDGRAWLLRTVEGEPVSHRGTVKQRSLASSAQGRNPRC